jgi:hypothetical protein
MADRKFKLIGRAKGCKIKSRIESEIKLNNTDVVLGENLECTLELKFMKDDVPTEIRITAEVPDGFKTFEEITINVLDKLKQQGVDVNELTFDSESQNSDEVEWAEEEFETEIESDGPVLEIPVRFDYEEGDTGIYSIEFNLTHDDYGTELSDAENIFVTIQPPGIKIEDCKADNPVVVKGSEVVIRTKIECESPIKFRGIMGGQVFTTDESVQHRRYELSTKRIAIIKSKEISWNFKIPNDETGTGNFDVEIEFASRDTATSMKFENVLSLRKSKAVNCKKFESSVDQVSENDEVEIIAKFENIGLEPVELTTKLKLELPSGQKTELDSITAADIQTGETKRFNWNWKVPAGMKLGTVKGTLSWEISDIISSQENTKELMEIKTPHEYSVSSVITDKDYYSVGDQVTIKTFFNDSGTKAGDRAEVELVILDIFKKEVYKERSEVIILRDETVKDWYWEIPSKFESGAYDVQFLILKNDEVMVKKNYQKLIYIDFPVNLKIQLILPDLRKKYSHIANYLRESEKILSTNDHNKLSIYTLNSNTWIYSINDQVPYGLDSWTKEELKRFTGQLFSYILISNKFSKNYIKSNLKNFNELGLCWSAKVIETADEVGLTEVSKFKLTPDTWLNFCDRITKKGKGNISKLIDKIFKLSKLPVQNFTCTLGGTKLLDNKLGLKGVDAKKVSQKYDACMKVLQSMEDFSNTRATKQILNEILNPWLEYIKSGTISSQPDEKLSKYSDLIHGIVELTLIKEIYTFLKKIEKTNYIDMNSFTRYIQLQIFYYLCLMEAFQNKERYDANAQKNFISERINSNIQLLDAIGREVSFLYDKWKNRINKYRQNMKKRNILANIRTNLKITINPVIIKGMKGEKSNNKIILGNSGDLPLKFKAFIAMPSKSWSLIEPVTYTTREGIALMKNIKIGSKQTIELPVSMLFPKSLSFKEYTSIMKIEPIMGKIVSEV